MPSTTGSSRLAEIRARLEVMKRETPWPGYPGVIRLSTQMRDSYAADIAWLLDRVRDLEVGILTACKIGSRGLNAQETQALASLMHDLDVPEVDDA